MQLPCPRCGELIKFQESLGGQRIVCRSCKRPLRMPLVAQLPPEHQEQYRREQDFLRQKAIRAKLQARDNEQAESWLEDLTPPRKEAEQQGDPTKWEWNEQQETEDARLKEEADVRRKQASENARLELAETVRRREEAEAVQRQQYLKVVADAKAEPDKAKIWHCSIRGKQHGPMRESMVQQWIDDGTLGKGDQVRVEGCDTWIQLSDLPERFHIPVHAVAIVAAPVYAKAIDAAENDGGQYEAGRVRSASVHVVGDSSVRCPKCGCTQITANKKGMSGGDACCGALLFGPLGVLCGLSGANKVIVTCLKCGHQWRRG